jgi:hypothetical protein
LVVICLIAAGVTGWLIGSMRPSATAMLIRGNPSSVTVSRYGPQPVGAAASNGWHPDRVVDVTSHGEVAKLVTDVNQLPLVPSGGYACPYSDGSNYELQFFFTNGDRRTIIAERQGCEMVGFQDDTSGTPPLIAWSMTDHRLLDDLDALFR